MKKMSRMPHEQSIPDTDPNLAPRHDGLPATDGLDVEAHRVSRFLPGQPGTGGDDFLPGTPGTGGDQIRQVVDDGDDDVEGHLMGRTKGERLNPGMPGTGGD